MKQWHTLYTKFHAEYQVAGALQKRGIQTYLPEVESTGRRCAREPFFPCYLFIRVDFKAVGLSSVRWTPGLRRIVAFDDQPVIIPDEAIDLIQRKLNEMDAAAGAGGQACAFKAGDTVRITNGPLQGMLAIFEKSTTPAERVQVLLTFLGNVNRAWVSVTDLEKVAYGPKRPRRTRGGGRRIRYK